VEVQREEHRANGGYSPFVATTKHYGVAWRYPGSLDPLSLMPYPTSGGATLFLPAVLYDTYDHPNQGSDHVPEGETDKHIVVAAKYVKAKTAPATPAQ
jgi:hypothetical protein